MSSVVQPAANHTASSPPSPICDAALLSALTELGLDDHAKALAHQRVSFVALQAGEASHAQLRAWGLSATESSSLLLYAGAPELAPMRGCERGVEAWAALLADYRCPGLPIEEHAAMLHASPLQPLDLLHATISEEQLVAAGLVRPGDARRLLRCARTYLHAVRRAARDLGGGSLKPSAPQALLAAVESRVALGHASL